MQLLREAFENILDIAKSKGRTTAAHTQADLSRCHLWHSDDIFLYPSIEETLGRMQRFRRCERRDDCACCHVNAPRWLDMAVRSVKKSQKGLCLSCFKDGAFSQSEENCSARTRKLCIGRA